MATTGRSGAWPDYMPDASTPLAQDTSLRAGLWTGETVPEPGYTDDMPRPGVVASQSKPSFSSCREDAASGPANRRSSTSVSRPSSLREPERGATLERSV